METKRGKVKKMNKLKSKRKRLDCLRELAVDRYLDKSGFDVFEWLTEEEIDEFEKLQKELGEK